MPHRITCHVCNQPLIIRDDAPPTVICPKCLARIRNPHFAGVTHDAAAAPLRPLPVIPIDQEVSEDFRGSTRNLLVLTLVLIVGGLLSAMRLQAPQLGSLLILLGIAMAIALGVQQRQQARQRATSAATLPLPPPELDSFGRPFLSYQAASDQFGIRVWPFIGGFFGGLGMCAAAMFVMLATVDLGDETRTFLKFGIIAALVLMFAVGLAGARALGKRRAWSGIGRGAAIGVGLGMMAVGPCALCYISI